MKTKQWLFAALTALLLAGCSAETDLVRPDEDVNLPVPQGMTRLSFEIKGVRTGTSYATAALTPEESQLKDMMVMLFPQSAAGKPQANDTVRTVLRAKIGKTAQGAPTAAVLIDETVPEGTYYAAIIANSAACFMLQIDITDDQTFELLASEIKNKKATYGELFLTSGPMKLAYLGYGEEYNPVTDFGLAMKALATDIKVAAVANRGDDIALTATMKRPMARFDIKNAAWESFTITGYSAKKVRPCADFCFSDEMPDWTDNNNQLGSFPAPQMYSTERSKQLNTPTDHDNNPLTPAVIGYTPAFYLCPGLESDNSVVEIYGDLEVGGQLMPLMVSLPLVTGTAPTTTPIAITANKRYKIELTLSQTNDNVVGSVVLDEGSWDDDGNGTGGNNIEQKLPGEILDPSAGTTYDETLGNPTFTAPDGATEFSFRLVATSNTIKPAEGADAGIISSVVGVATLAPSTTYTVKMTVTGTTGKLIEEGKDKDGNPVTVKTYTVNRVPIDPTIYPPTNLPTILVDSIYWAPVNVGATAIGEQGYLFQYGRMKGWPNATAMNNAKVFQEIPIADADKDPDNVYLKHTGGGHRWWPDTESQESLDALIARWSAVSNGSNNPCPKGWRLPTRAEVAALIAAQTITQDQTNMTATVRGIVFPYKEKFVAGWDGSAGSAASTYWLATYLDHCSVHQWGIEVYDSTQSADGCSIRCVRSASTN